MRARNSPIWSRRRSGLEQIELVDAPFLLIPAHSASKTRVNALMVGIRSRLSRFTIWVPLLRGRADIARVPCNHGARECFAGAGAFTFERNTHAQWPGFNESPIET